MQFESNTTVEIEWESGARGVFEAANTFGGGTLHLEKSLAEQWYPVVGADGAPVEFTASAAIEFVTGSNRLRVRLEGATAPSIKAFVTKIRS